MNEERNVFLSEASATRHEVWFLRGAVLISAVLFAAAIPFATRELTPIPAFIPAYESALVICDLVTAVLLFCQFYVLRSRALLVLASGYTFTAFIAFAHALTFPRVFSETGLLGAGPQSTAWLYMFWHGAFPLFVILYSMLKNERRAASGGTGLKELLQGHPSLAIMVGIAAAFAIACGSVLIATAGHDLLPALIVDNRFTPAMKIVVAVIWVVSFLTLPVLWWRRPRTVLDMWLMVVMCAWLFDIGLSAVLAEGRYDLGWYAGRIYGLIAASSLLVVLLVENAKHYARLAHLSEKSSAANAVLEQLSLQDGLTDCANRRSFDKYLAAQIAIARRHNRNLALVLCDIDAFKAYNDHYGHQAGDECLKRVAAALKACCRRPLDMVARYGGEEFAMILPDTDLAGAGRIAEAARAAVWQSEIAHAYSPAGPVVSISGGVAVLLGKIDMTAEQLIAAADKALFQAKRLGRNRMVSVQAAVKAVAA